MSKQTVEEAALAHAKYEMQSSEGIITKGVSYDKEDSFLAGSAWQKQQGMQASKQMMEALQETKTWLLNCDAQMSESQVQRMLCKVQAALSAALD